MQPSASKIKPWSIQGKPQKHELCCFLGGKPTAANKYTCQVTAPFLVAARCIQNQAWGYNKKTQEKSAKFFWCFLQCCVFYVKALHARLGSSASFSRATPHQSLQLVLQSYPGQHRSLFDQVAHMVQKYVRMGSLQVSARPQCTHKNCRATQSNIKSHLILC